MLIRSANLPSGSDSDSPSSSSSSDYSTSSGISNESGGPLHPASLVDPLRHSPELLQLLDLKLSPSVIAYVVDCITDAVEHALTASRAYPRGRPILPSSALISFASTVLSRAQVSVATILVALAYIARVRSFLCISEPQYAFERAFLGALMCASKYTQDSPLKNVHWSICSGVFSKNDIGRIEREFLSVLDWQLAIREKNVLIHYAGMMRAAGPPALRNASPEKWQAAPLLTVPRSVHRHHRQRSTSSTDSVPSLEPSSPESNGTSPSPWPRTPPPRSVPVIPPHIHKYLPNTSVDVVDMMHDVELQAPGPMHGSKTYGSRFHHLLRTFSFPHSNPVPVRRAPLPHAHYHTHSQSRPPSTGPLSLMV
ncbi:hypothetical protein FB45DRAFT_939816 [Roridomyces roridus]|uniref:Cyclin N-terminal domain-containing protein n=1 Tax=Roridomyces roridus TaxID=1738132 RepID=A0AAD7B6Y7_9AGAR|nr:hypothetical protein FB45DRAFT_957944 [Roridomyces roridus]KAJ7612079.1 hypothetical protein FB45DRAFT_939816 [Roridomyces roridus]